MIYRKYESVNENTSTIDGHAVTAKWARALWANLYFEDAWVFFSPALLGGRDYEYLWVWESPDRETLPHRVCSQRKSGTKVNFAGLGQATITRIKVEQNAGRWFWVYETETDNK